MCEHDHSTGPVPSKPLERRHVLAGAAALAGLGLTGVLPAGALAAEPAASPASLPLQRGKGKHPGAVIIEGGTLIDPGTGHATEDAVVVLADGVVQAAGTRDETRKAVREAGAKATRINAHGKFVLPGFVDAHVHAQAFEDAALILSHGATTVRSGSSSFYQDIALARVPHHAPGLAPRMHAAGLFVSPDQGDSILADPDLAPLAARRKQLTDPKDLAHLTRVNRSRGATVIKTRANPRAGIPEQDPLELVYGKEQLSAIVHAAKGAGVLCHAYSAKGIAGAVAAGVKSIEHGVFVDEETLARMAKRGTYFTPTLFGIAGMADSGNSVLAERGRTYGPILAAAARAANELGVAVIGGTDSFGTDVIPIGDEANALAEAGLGKLKALQSITTAPAKLLGVERDGVGRLVRHGVADVVVLDRNPLETSKALSEVRVVIAQGAIVRNDLR
ncbi:amidohydrolase family protein [Paeniglutamicibacter kerguelensis]|uniref:Imidazolonepropionase-like amidohydrolase n=1 Tax=Paeniglutamicibacter kerguelensis TaxID=254788 RepID=A0ABS4XBK2_9MICC|nr:amidohydrolase family protein [Paeniglutamicibacter kerguelensis]MBP2385628.1 imidazolonepropionase-like amidohydrolase [Paeniglutamicibacter kerguelensis]